MRNLKAYNVGMRLTVNDVETLINALRAADCPDASSLLLDMEEVRRFHVLGDAETILSNCSYVTSIEDAD